MPTSAVRREAASHKTLKLAGLDEQKGLPPQEDSAPSAPKDVPPPAAGSSSARKPDGSKRKGEGANTEDDDNIMGVEWESAEDEENNLPPE